MYTNFPEPDYPAALGIISHLSSDELKDILNDETKFEELMKDIKQFKDLETEKEMIIASNRSLAEFNLAKEPQLQEGKQRLQDLSAKGEELCQSVESKIGELRSKTADLSLDTTLALLQTSAAESEEESEAIAEKFLEGDLEIDGFLEQFSARRKLMHLRRVKADKMTELLAERSRSPNVLSRSSTSSSQVSHFNSPSFYPLPPVSGSAGATPYPVGGINMPMPMPGPYRANVY
ncbi:hypothetical protein R5R35_006263 [Gryllus longicercus]|uniref:VPS37 C-terminal domain-containing protein n=1 Tax=Gryllus longicercus TaxID=2509291 RepID=A0AAN9W1F5_9ORTH